MSKPPSMDPDGFDGIYYREESGTGDQDETAVSLTVGAKAANEKAADVSLGGDVDNNEQATKSSGYIGLLLGLIGLCIGAYAFYALNNKTSEQSDYPRASSRDGEIEEIREAPANTLAQVDGEQRAIEDSLLTNPKPSNNEISSGKPSEAGDANGFKLADIPGNPNLDSKPEISSYLEKNQSEGVREADMTAVSESDADESKGVLDKTIDEHIALAKTTVGGVSQAESVDKSDEGMMLEDDREDRVTVKAVPEEGRDDPQSLLTQESPSSTMNALERPTSEIAAFTADTDKQQESVADEAAKEFTLRFSFDSTTLAESESVSYSKLVDFARQCRHQLLIIGHTCRIGSTDVNVLYGLERAKVTRDYLTSRGISSEQMTVRSDGEDNPIATNETWTGRAQNRRVVVRCTNNANLERGV